MRILVLTLLAAFTLTALVPPAYAETRLRVRDPYFYREGQDTISGKIYNVKRGDLRIQTPDGRVKVDMDMIDFNDRLNEIFTEGMNITAEGVYKDSDEFTAYKVSFVKDKKRYIYRTRERVPYQRLYKKLK